jgi:spermidine/putrescine transport system permease protein
LAKRERGTIKEMNNKLKTAFKQELPFFFYQPAIIWQVLFFYVPILFIFFISFKQIGAAFLSGFTIDNYSQFFAGAFLKIMSRSIALAFFSALFCLIIGYPVAYYIARKADRWKNVMLFFLILPFWTNMLVQVYAWFAVLEHQGFLNLFLLKVGLIAEPLTLLNNRFAVYMVMVYYYLPFMILPIYAVLEKLDESLVEASRDLGATQRQTFMRVILPLSLSGVMTGFFLVFVPAFGEFVIPGLMGGNKLMYVGSLISYYYLVARNEPLGAAFTVVSCVALILSALLIYGVFSRFIRQEKGL